MIKFAWDNRAATRARLAALYGSCAVLLACGGCESASREREAYEAIWVSSEQANPSVKHVAAGEAGNLLDSPAYVSRRTLSVRDVLTEPLKLQMRSYKLEPNLAGLIELLTRPLAAPIATEEDDLQFATWLLGTRNMFWSTLPTKSAEVHHGLTGEVLLMLRTGKSALLKSYSEEGGVIVEYLYRETGE